jgi:hypothetical protein
MFVSHFVWTRFTNYVGSVTCGAFMEFYWSRALGSTHTEIAAAGSEVEEVDGLAVSVRQ